MSDLEWELFDRYFAGVATAAEREQFEQWMAERPENAAVVVAWRRALEALEDDVTEGEEKAIWAGILERTGVSVPVHAGVNLAEEQPVSYATAKPRRWQYGAGLAAALLAAGGLLVGRALLTHRGPASVETSERVVTVPRGERVRLRLPDGTDVLLGAGSTLRHPQTFAGASREVWLEGEAYFAVAHDDRRPFRVRAGDLTATDLGTEFLVRAYPENAGTQVVVRSGAVVVRSSAEKASPPREGVVRPGQMGRLGADGIPLVVSVDTAAYFAWTDGTLVFDGTPLREALPQLSRWYNLDFRLGDSSLGAIPLSGRLDQTVTPARLDLLAASLGLEQVTRGQEVTFYSSTDPRRDSRPAR